MMNTKILITGLNSLIGWHTFLHLKNSFQVYGTFAKRHAVLEGDAFIRLDLDNFKETLKFVKAFQPDYVIHARGICDLDLCELMPEMAWDINVKGTEKLLKACQQVKKLKKIVYISTDHVFDGEEGKYHEHDAPFPKHVYGQTKLEAEARVQASDIDHLIIRPGLVIGESFQGNKGARDFLFSRIRAKKPTHLFTDEWRSPIEVNRLVSQMIERIFSEAEGIYHLADPEVCNRFDLGRQLAIERGLPTDQIFPRLRGEDEWAHIRPRDISLVSAKEEVRQEVS